MSAAATAWQPPPQFDEYRLIRPLGRGSMGQVYLAHDTLLDRLVAVKLISGIAPDESQRVRFRTEARAIARVKHPNVIDIYRVGEVQRHPYLVSEFLRGSSLDQIAKPVPWRRALGIGIGLARGLAAAHGNGVLHRDIKPANALLTEDEQVKLLDFGVAKLLDATGPAEPPAPEAAPRPPHAEPRPTSSTVELPSPAASPAPAQDGAAGPAPPSTGLVGTPLYMAPELWRGGAASARSDIYSLGVLLYELCCGATPHSAASARELSEAVQRHPAPALAQVAPEVDPAFAALVTRCLAREPADRFSSAEALREALEALHEDTRGAASLSERPYPGLHPFSARDWTIFHGRGAAVRAVSERLRSESLVVVAGDSGVGKSSLCRAGVLPGVTRGAFGHGSEWKSCELVPGRRPLEALAGVLASAVGGSERELLRDLRESPHELGRRVGELAPAQSLLVLVDQLEELLTLSSPPDSERFAMALSSLAHAGPRLKVLATARSDFLTRLASLPGLEEHLAGRGLYLLTHMTEAGLREAVVAPARAHGYAFESPELVELLVDAGRAEGALPLLQFALSELWERRDRERGLMTAEAQRAVGGVGGALARYADGVLAGLRPAQQEEARRILVRLVLEEGARARRSAGELLSGKDRGGEARATLEALVRGRLVVAREAAGAQGEATYELAHEALLRSWDTLRGWLAGGEELRALRRRLDRASSDWHQLGRPRELLWRGRQLAEAARLEQESLVAGEAAFLRASRQAWRRGRIGLAAAIALPLLGVAAGALWGLQVKARQVRERVAESMREAQDAMARAAAEDSQVEAIQRTALDRFDAYQMTKGNQLWADSQVHAGNEATAHDEAIAALEAALLQDGDRLDVRQRLAEALYRSILAAERDHNRPRLGLLEKRLKPADVTGEWGRRLIEPALLSVESDPPSDGVILEQFVDEPGRARWERLRSLGPTPLRDVSLPPGSYRLTLQLALGASVYFPVLLRRGERYQARVPIPSQVPAGYVYVPRGRFLIGSTDEESVRLSVRKTWPLHELETEGYLIGRNEVTYAEYLAYLRSLPPEEQRRRRPHATNYFGSIGLTLLDGGKWEFSLSHGETTYRALEGEPVRYRNRDHRVVQDWLRFPVSAISFEDGVAYLAWLDGTGRLTGARMCTEREWERAARGADGRDYPSGSSLAPEDANFDATYGRKPGSFGPDEVGSHRASDSPFGVSDMSGNVGEWMVRAGQKATPVYQADSFYTDVDTARSINHGDRSPAEAEFRWPFLGLRVCAPAPPTQRHVF